MRILIVSDTHGHHRNFDRAVKKAGKFDMLIHLGDLEGGEAYVEAALDCPVHMVAGNNDFFSDLKREEEFEIGGYRVMITHGHYYYVSMGVEVLVGEARARGADIVMFGHTHKPFLEEREGVIVLNPGSRSYPRQQGHRGSYMIMEINEHGEAQFFTDYV